jgi:hypothetical protein
MRKILKLTLEAAEGWEGEMFCYQTNSDNALRQIFLCELDGQESAHTRLENTEPWDDKRTFVGVQ